jgi:membrane protein implicated in regulation of membrane protease activity
VGTATTAFLAVGALGVVVLALSLVLGDVFGVDAAGDGPFSLAVVAGAVGGFGFVAAIVSTLLGGVLPGLGAGLLGATAGVVAAVPFAGLVTRMTRVLVGRTDKTLSSADLLGAHGVVVTDIRAGGYGEVHVVVGGQQLKYNARADSPLAAGTAVFVVETPSPTSVVVVETTAIS